jgi:hypothetical protein
LKDYGAAIFFQVPCVRKILTRRRIGFHYSLRLWLREEGIAMFGLKKTRLRCGFCGCTDKQAARMLGSASGRYICDACVSTCNEILAATPEATAQPGGASDAQLLSCVRACEASVAALRSLQKSRVDLLRKREVSWAAIGEALGVSRQAAWERFSGERTKA